jgi:hypothetical protein
VTAGSPGAELATLVRLVAPLENPADPLAALSWAPAGAGVATLARHVLLRARTAASAHAAAAAVRRRPEVVRPVRGSLREGLRDRVRRRAGRGYVAYVRGQDGPSLLDVVLDEADVTLLSGPAVGADGAVRARVTRTATPGLLRMGLTDTPADPSWAVQGLRALPRAPDLPVPAVLASGESVGVTWVVEELLPGRRPSSLSPELLDQVAAFAAALPPGDRPAGVRDDAEVVASAAPASAAAVRQAAEVICSSPLAGRTQLRHGDLWAGNLLVLDGTLTGVVDWDAWSPAGVPGVDLLHLLGTDWRIRSRSSLGEVWLRRPWDDAVFVTLVRRHWADWGGDPAVRAVVGRAWWLGQLAADLRRNPALAADARWVARNITAVAHSAA